MAWGDLVQSRTGSGTSGASLAYLATPTAGNALSAASGSLSAVAITGSANTFLTFAAQSGGGITHQLAYVLSAVGSAETVSSSGGNPTLIHIFEYEGTAILCGSSQGATTGTAANSGNYNVLASDIADGAVLAIGSGTKANANAVTAGGSFVEVTETTGAGTFTLQVQDINAHNVAGNLASTKTWTGTTQYLETLAVFRRVPPAHEQEAFRWGVDDANEASHGWEAAEDTNITLAENNTRLLRVLANVTDDPVAIPYNLRAQKNGTGGYIPVAMGAPGAVSVTWGAAGTGSSNATAATPSYPTGIAAATSWLYCVVTSGASGEPTPTMPAGWTSLGSLSGGSGAAFGADVGNRRVTLFKKDEVVGNETGTVTVSLSGGNTMRATIFRVEVPAGFSITEQWSAGDDTSHGTGWSVATSSETFAVDDLVLAAIAQSTDTATLSSESLTASGVTFGTVTNRLTDAVTTGNDHRHVLYSAPVTGGATATPTWAHTNSANASGPTAIIVLRAVAPQVYITTSANITASGEATTARLTAPSGKSTSDFATGRRWDDENGTDTVDISEDDYTELEWCLRIVSPATNGDYFDFRVYGNNPFDTYSITPRWTIGSGGFDAALMAAINQPWPSTVIGKPSVVASGMTPSNRILN